MRRGRVSLLRISILVLPTLCGSRGSQILQPGCRAYRGLGFWHASMGICSVQHDYVLCSCIIVPEDTVRIYNTNTNPGLVTKARICAQPAPSYHNGLGSRGLGSLGFREVE